jgi:hypothetical protein
MQDNVSGKASIRANHRCYATSDHKAVAVLLARGYELLRVKPSNNPAYAVFTFADDGNAQRDSAAIVKRIIEANKKVESCS